MDTEVCTRRTDFLPPCTGSFHDAWSQEEEAALSRDLKMRMMKCDQACYDLRDERVHVKAASPKQNSHRVPCGVRQKRPTKLLIWSLVTILLCCKSSLAAFVNFQNCLDPSIINSTPLRLQFVPLFVSATFNTSDPARHLNVTVYGNVSGIATQQSYPPPDDPQWQSPNGTVGKILDISPTNDHFSTLFATLNVLSYTPYNAPTSQFCNSVVQGECPIAPVFGGNA